MLIPVLVLCLAAGPPQSADTVPRSTGAVQRPDTALPTDAYLDPVARKLVAQARARRLTVDRSIREYTTVAQERISAGLRTLGRERLLYRRESATRIDWRRDSTVTLEPLAAREVVPPITGKVQVPTDLRRYLPHLAFDPVDDEMLVRLDTTFVHHPLAVGSERYYRFRSGDTTTIRLPDGRTVRLIELEILPREQDVHLVTGSFWLDQDTHAVVRALFRLARAYDLERDAEDKDDADDVPGILKPVRAELQYITMEYGLWELHWWLPRYVAAAGVFQMGSFLRMPLSYERRYSEYHVIGDTAEAPIPRAQAGEAALPRCHPEFEMDVTVQTGDEKRDTARANAAAARRAARDSARAARTARARADTTAADRNRYHPCRPIAYSVKLPPDDSTLLHSPYLPPSIYDPGEALATESELRDLGNQLKDIPQVPWQWHRPSLAWGLGASGLVRYNRVEGLSVGARSQLDLGRVTVDGTARIGLADLEPNAELGLRRETVFTSYRLAAYRRLAEVDPRTRALGFGNSVNALLLGRDDGDYFRTLGVELTGRPAATETPWYSWRLYAERQRGARAETDLSLPHVFDKGHVFRPNIAADPADEVGADIVLRTAHGLNPEGLRWGAELAVNSATGTFDFARPGLTLNLGLPLPRRLYGSLEVGAGTSVGTVPIQSLWYLGGPATLRGYGGAAAAGDAFWRARAELAAGIPGFRLAVFSDAGWAGSRNAFTSRNALISAGAGVSVLDGLIRLDLARALRSPTGWRADLYVSAWR